MGPESHEWYLYKRKGRETWVQRQRRHAPARRPRDNGSRDWSDACSSEAKEGHGTPRTAGGLQRLGGGRKGFSSRPFRGSTALLTP